MRNLNSVILSGADNQNVNGSQIDSNQLLSASFQAVFGDTQAAGTFKAQGSNDFCNYGNLAADFTVTNWTDIPTSGIQVGSATISSGASALLFLPNICYRWLRAIFTTTGIGTQTVAPIADTGAFQSQTITTVADVAGSLNNKYLLLSSVDLVTKAQKDFYIWFNINSAGTDPLIAGRTAIPITGATNVSANTLATSIRSALNALTNDFTATGSNAAVVVSSVAFGPVPPAADGAAPTGFTFGSATLGITSNLVNTFFLLQDEAGVHKYLIWNNVDSIGTAPVLAGYSAQAVVFASGSSAGTIGTALATLVAGLNSSNSFTATGTTTVTITNKTAGPFVPIVDGSTPTGFTFAVTAGGHSTVVATINAVGF